MMASTEIGRRFWVVCKPIPKEVLVAYFQILFHHSPGNSLLQRKTSVDTASNRDGIQTGYISCVYSVATV
jgi:hypothetical protein